MIDTWRRSWAEFVLLLDFPIKLRQIVYTTVITDLTPVADRTDPARLLDMVVGRSKSAFAAWLAARPARWHHQVEVVAVDGFTGFKATAVEEAPHVVTVMDPADASMGPSRPSGSTWRPALHSPTHPAYRHRSPHRTPSSWARCPFSPSAPYTTVEVTWAVYPHVVAATATPPDTVNGRLEHLRR